MIIRYAKIEDLPEIVQIYNSTISSRMVTADLEPLTVEQKMEWFLEHNMSRRPLFVVEENGHIIGWLSFSSFYGRPAYDRTNEISIYIKEEFRGKGIGKTLLEKAIAFAPNIKVENILAFIFAHNIPSIKLFEKYKFEKWAHLPGVAVLDGVSRDLLIFGIKASGKK